MDNARGSWRRAVLLGVPALYVVLGLMHPTANPGLGGETDLFVWLHIMQLFLITGLGFFLWLIVDGIENRAAVVARVLILPFVVAYTALDSILGIAWGIAAETANQLPVRDQAGAGRLIEELISGEPDVRGLILYFGAGLLWLAVAVAVVVALRDPAPTAALVLMSLGAAVFALGHAPPMGPVGMGLFLVGVVWTEVRPRRPETARPRVSPVAGSGGGPAPE